MTRRVNTSEGPAARDGLQWRRGGSGAIEGKGLFAWPPRGTRTPGGRRPKAEAQGGVAERYTAQQHVPSRPPERVGTRGELPGQAGWV